MARIDLYEIIKSAAAKKGISIRSLESRLGFGRGAISKWRSHNPSARRIKAVADCLGIPLDNLLAEERREE